MNQPLRVLLVEDSENDALLLLRLLRKGGYESETRRVETQSDMRAALAETEWDIIISDYSMPGFDGLTALKLYHEANLDIPFILVSGTIGEEIAVEAMLAGAHDYLMKGNLARLVPAIQRELHEAQIRRAHRQAQEALQTSEKKYRMLVEYAPSGIYEFDFIDGRFISVNEVMCEYTGYTKDEFLNLNPLELLTEESQQQFLARQAQVQEEGIVPELVEYKIRGKNGKEFWVNLQTRVIQEDDRLKALVVVHDITERKLAEESLRKLSHAVEQSPASVVITNSAGIIEYVNPKFTQVTGYTFDETLGKNPRILKSGHTPPEEYRRLWETIASGGEWRGEFLNRKKNGELYWEAASISPVRNADGMITHFIAVKEDITERKRAEEALRLNNFAVEMASDAVYWVDKDMNIADVNQAACRMLGYSRDEFAGMSIIDIDPTVTADEVESLWLQTKEKGTLEFETCHETEDGRVFPVEIVASYISYEGREFSCCFVRDITERKQIAEALQHYTQRLEILREIDQQIVIAHSPEAIADAVLERLVLLIPCEWAGVVLYNKEMSEETVIACQHAPGITISVGDSQPVVMNQVHERLMSGKSVVTDDLGTQEGPVAKLTEELLVQGAHSAMANPIITQRRLIGVLSLASKQIGFFTSEHQQIAEELGTQMAIALHQAELYDRIARHNAELEQRVRERTMQLEAANEELRVLSRVKDEFVSNVSHELRTPISNLKLRHHLLGARPDSWEKQLAVMSRETQRLEHIIESLLYLSRLDQDRVGWNPILVNLNHLTSQFVRDRVALAQSRELSLSFTGEPDLPLVEADVALWEQALSVLLTNAFNYTLAGGYVEVRTQIREREGQRWVGVSVSDTGPGILPDEQTHLFERFFRGTVGRESGAPGTGLGLSIVQEIVNKHRGQIEVVSEGVPGKGTTFNLWLLAV